MGDVKVRGACAGNEERLTPADRGVFFSRHVGGHQQEGYRG
jgi:hypothetical protein